MKRLILLFFIVSFNLSFSQTLSTSLTACYALDGTGTEPINSLTGTLSAVTSTVNRFAVPNTALHFNGTNGSYIKLPNSPLLKPTNALSFSAWINLDNVGINHYLVFAHNTCASWHEGYTMTAENSGFGCNVKVVKSSGACSPGTQKMVQSVTNLNAGTWYHIGCYVGNDSLKLYVNGALEASLPIAIPFNYNPTDNVYLGGSGLAFNMPMMGSMDNVRFYNRKLTDGEFNQLYLTDPTCVPVAAPVNCGSSFYAMVAGPVAESNTGIPNTSTVTTIVPPGSGLAIGPAFGFAAPNPTYWTTSGGTLWYFDGTTFVNTGHSTGNVSAVNIGGSKNFIYNLVGGTGQVYVYNGTGPATLLATIPALAGGGPYDLVGDDQDNFYYLRTLPPQSLNVYDMTGAFTCSYSVNGIGAAGAGGGFAIVGNTVTAHNGVYYVGTFSGATVNFTSTPTSFGAPSDFANCYLVNTFNSTVTASPNATVTCAVPIVTLTATSTLTPLSYTWTGPGILTSPTSSVVNVNLPGLYTCTLINAGCPNKTSISTFSVIAGPGLVTPTVASAGNLSCASATTQLSVAPNSPTNTILWNGPGIVGANNTATINVNAGGTYSVTVTNTVTGCSGTSTINLLSSIAPLSLTMTPSSAQICSPSGSSVSINVSGATSYTWSPSSSLTSSVGANVTASPTITTTYTVNGITGVCSGSAMVTVSVNPTPTVLNTSGNPTVCSGGQATLTASGATTYTWNPGGIPGASITINPIATTVFTVIGSNGTCTSSANATVTTVSLPTVTAVSNPTTICSASGSSATLTASGAVNYIWNPGVVISPTLVITPTVTTTYSVTGVNATGCLSTYTLSYFVTPTPTLNPVSSSTAICSGNSATLSSNGAASYTWNPGAVSGGTITVSPLANTVYTVTGANGSCTSTKTINLVVNANPTLSATSTASVICSGSSSTLTGNGALSYTWNPGAVNNQTVNVTPGSTTIYTVSGSNAAGCIASATTNVVVNTFPTVTITASAISVCQGNSSTLTASGASTYTWSPSGVVNPAIAVTPTLATTYTVTGANGNCVSTQTVSLIVIPNPTITVTTPQTILCCPNPTAVTIVTLTAGGGISYTWAPMGTSGSTVSLLFPSCTGTVPNIHTYSVSGTNGGCTSTGTISLIGIDCSNTMFGLTKAMSPIKAINETYEVTYSVTAVNASTVNLNNVTLLENLNGTFPYPTSYAIVSSPSITSKGSSLTINPSFDGISQISLTSPATSTLLAGKRDTIVFTVLITPTSFFGPFNNWVVGSASYFNGIVADSSNNGFNWDPDNDGNPTNNNLPTVVQLPDVSLFIPTGISPDGDGYNDFFVIKGLKGRMIRLTVFNRWGNKVYVKTDYDNSWNGYPNVVGFTVGDGKLPPATYYYIVEFLDGNKESFTGYVVLQY